MRTLLLFRGAPGCGKSTFIDSHGLRPYALSADDIRQTLRSPMQTAGCQKPAFSFIFKHLYELECCVFKNRHLGNFYELVVATMQ